MFASTDTIVAIATPHGRGGIGVVRLSGPDAHHITARLTRHEAGFQPRYATLARVDTESGAGDRVVVTVFPAPHSYTGEDVAEISAHGSPVLLEAIVRDAMRCGARLAAPGEFTLRAFLKGRIDLVQAEAVRDLVDAVTPLQARAAFDQLEGTLTADIRDIDAALLDLCARLEASLDFPGEGYHFVDAGRAAAEIDGITARVAQLLIDAHRGRLIREGAQIVLAGRPNTGKSSLFNLLAGAGRAIVTATPGTTRDLLTERVDLGGIPVTLVDTAGLRHLPQDIVEAEGIARAAAARRVAGVVVVVLDGSVALADEDRALVDERTRMPGVIVRNKIDLAPAWPDEDAGAPLVRVSALTGEGADALRAALLRAMQGGDSGREVPAITNARHADLLESARAALERAASAARDGVPEEFVLEDLNEARRILEEITGSRTPDDLLGAIFSSFCIGK